MAYAMIGGIIVGTMLTLLFLPALYVDLVPHQGAGAGFKGFKCKLRETAAG